jgi:GH15 family glucan-1,4-alpha-glucosidase
MARRIEDYALIGDCQTAALVGRDGSIDWLCLPRFDSEACFAALLGKPGNGRWRIAPLAAPCQVRRRYLPDTLVLETEFASGDGTFAVIDFMPVRESVPDLVRIVEGRRGAVPVRSELIIRFDYGSIVPWVRKVEGGLAAIAGPNALLFRSSVPNRGEDMTTVSEFTIREGDRVSFGLTWHRSYDPPPRPLDPEQALTDTIRWWKEWTARCRYDGPYREQVMRSLITLKSLTYMPSGGILAAATTSLPEQIGGVRNWDYRYCWLRDATLSLLALLHGGYTDEARAWRDWLLRSVAGDPSKLQIMYGIAGERRLTEYEVPWLTGFEDSKPVRIGNAAHQQFQLDVYGEVLDVLYQASLHGIEPSGADWNVTRALLGFVEKSWDQPDEGIWEVRGPRQHFTHSKVMAWVALDRGIKLAERFQLEGPFDRWKSLREEIHRRVCAEGFNHRLGSFTQVFESDLLDASLLMIPLVGFLPPEDRRVHGTVAAIEKSLVRDGFVQRYDSTRSDDGLPPGEGAFLPCSFWWADCHALMGNREQARQIFERLLAVSNDVGLLSEEYDPAKKHLLGNLPQAFSHLGLVNTALTMHRPGRGPGHQRQSRSTS